MYMFSINWENKELCMEFFKHMINGHATGTDFLEMPTIDKADFLGLNFREYPHNKIWPVYGTAHPLYGT